MVPDKKELPLISVVLPVYNGQEFIARSIESVIAQNYEAIELIVINDGSTDSTEKALRTFETGITYIKQSNHGPSHARNIGVKAANGKFVAFIDADDVWISDSLSNHMYQFQKFKNLDVSLGLTCELEFENTSEIDLKHARKNSSLHLSLCASVIKKAVFDKVGYFDEVLLWGEDTDWFLRARDKKLKIAVSRKLVLLYRRHLKNRTNNKKMSKFYLFKLFKKTKDRRAGSQNSLESIMKKPENQNELIEMWHSAI